MLTDQELQKQIREWLEGVRDREGRSGAFRLDVLERPEQGDYQLRPVAIPPQGQEIAGELIGTEAIEYVKLIGNVSPIQDQLTNLARQLPKKSP